MGIGQRVDREYLESLLASTDSAFVAQLGQAAETAYHESAAAARNALAQGKLDEARKLAHRIASTCRNIGAVRVADMAKKIELESEMTLTSCRDRLAVLDDEFERTMREWLAAADVPSSA